MKAYQITLRMPDVDTQATDDRAVAIASRIAEELGASTITVFEVDLETGESFPIFAGSR